MAASIPPRTLAQTQAAVAEAEAMNGTGAAMARLMARHGNVTDEARKWAAEYAAEKGV